MSETEIAEEDIIERLKFDIGIKKIVIGSLVKAYETDTNLKNVMAHAKKMMTDGYDPWEEAEKLRSALEHITEVYEYHVKNYDHVPSNLYLMNKIALKALKGEE